MVLFINLLGKGLTQEIKGDGGSIKWALNVTKSKVEFGMDGILPSLTIYKKLFLFSLKKTKNCKQNWKLCICPPKRRRKR